MISITPEAVEEVKRLIEKRGTPEMGLRLGVRGGGCSGLSYVMDFAKEPENTDKVLDYDGLKVFIDPKSFLFLNGIELDFNSGITNHGFQFRNPNAKTSCGCGLSFTT
jgi:iron-sulfur cluster assembly protein